MKTKMSFKNPDQWSHIMFITQPSTVIPATNIHTHYLNKMDRMPNVMHLAHNCYRVMVRIVLELYPPCMTHTSVGAGLEP